MKHIIKASVVCLASALAVSCTDFLTENPVTQLSESRNVYGTEEYLETQLEGVYSVLHGGNLWTSYRMEFLDCASTLTFFGKKRTTDEWLDQMKLTKYSNSTRGNTAMWAQLYTGVNRCNRLLDNLPSSPVDQAYKTEIEAETRLIRAILYYDIVRFWGDCPLHLKSPSTVDESNLERTAFYRVYAQILKDLNYAQAHMRDKVRQEEINPEKDHFYNYAALAYKSSVYLTIGSLLSAPANDQFWDSSKDAALIAAGKDPRTPDFKPCGITCAEDAFKRAMECADSVIEFGPYRLADDYRTLFRWRDHSDFFLEEAICRLQISKSAGSGNVVSWVVPAYPEGTKDTTQYNGNCYNVTASRWGVENFIKRTGGALGTGTYNKTVYATTLDPRYSTAIRSHYLRLDDMTTRYGYPELRYASDRTQPFLWKYVNPEYNGDVGQCAFYMMRLAEMYLISAEAAAQLCGGPGDALWNKAIDRVMVLRDRAAKSNDSGVTDPNVAAALKWEKSGTFETKEDLVMGVWWERYIELGFEGHEYLDTHRYGATWLSEKIVKPANEFYLTNTANVAFVSYYFPDATTEIYPQDPVQLRKSLLLAFPQTELTTNPKLGGTAGANDFYWQ